MRALQRHLFNQAALDGGYDVIATGHNLDDEAAVLFGNVLRWDLPTWAGSTPSSREPRLRPQGQAVDPAGGAGDGRLLRAAGIDYIVEECPMAAGNRHLGYKDALNAIEVTSPGSKAAFYSGSSTAWPPWSSPTAPRRSGPGCILARVRGAHRQRALRLLQARQRVAAASSRKTGGPVSRTVRGRRTGSSSSTLRGAATWFKLAAGGEFHTHAGPVPHDDSDRAARRAGWPDRPAAPASSPSGPPWRRSCSRCPGGAQVIYPKDLVPILIMADVFPGARVFESGLGSGALSMARCVPGAEVTGYELRADFVARAQANVAAFLGAGALDRYRVEIRDAYDGVDEHRLRPGRAGSPRALAGGQGRRGGAAPGRHPGRLPADHRPGQHLPGHLGAQRLRSGRDDRSAAARAGMWRGSRFGPDHRMVAHTGFLTSARLLGAAPSPAGLAKRTGCNRACPNPASPNLPARTGGPAQTGPANRASRNRPGLAHEPMSPKRRWTPST